VAFLLSLPLVIFAIPFFSSISRHRHRRLVVLLLFPNLLESVARPSSFVLIPLVFLRRLLSHTLTSSTVISYPRIFLSCRHSLFFDSFRSRSNFFGSRSASYHTSHTRALQSAHHPRSLGLSSFYISRVSRPLFVHIVCSNDSE
jgi:hypothetical protein